MGERPAQKKVIEMSQFEKRSADKTLEFIYI